MKKKISVLLLADSSCSHSKKIVEGFSKREDIKTVYVFSLNKNSIISESPKIHSINHEKHDSKIRIISKVLYYLKAIFKLKKLLRSCHFDVVNAHFATSYGLLASIVIPNKFILSVWGSDIFVYPKQSFLLRTLIKYNLSKAKLVLSTSHIMKEECKKYTKTEILVTPFGVDTQFFKPMKPEKVFFSEDTVVIGCVKRLEMVAGVDILIKAFHQLLLNEYKEKKCILLIVGMGSQYDHLKKLTQSLGIENNVHFTQYIKPENINNYHNTMDIEVYPSRHESFGVSILEAMACERPVIVSNVEGLPEIVEHEKTGYIVDKLEVNAFYYSMKKILSDSQKQKKLGIAARKHVLKNYELMHTLDRIISIYKSFIQ